MNDVARDDSTTVPKLDTPIFVPDPPETEASRILAELSPFGTGLKRPYVHHDDRIALAVNIALATRRPLLLSGRPGSGKSSLASHVAECLGWEYLQTVVTSRTQAQDLQWQFDALQRLNDAHTPGQDVSELKKYVRPGVLWWAFDPTAAVAAQGLRMTQKRAERLDSISGVVVLLDEIDKAEPDVPNDLLVPLAERHFEPTGYSDPVESKLDYLLCITTNGERELPQAFVRRCVTLPLARPTDPWLEKIADEHVPEEQRPEAEGAWESLVATVLSAFRSLEEDMEKQRRRPPSTAEFLDAVRASLRLQPDQVDRMAGFVMRKVITASEALQ